MVDIVIASDAVLGTFTPECIFLYTLLVLEYSFEVLVLVFTRTYSSCCHVDITANVCSLTGVKV